MIFFVAWLAEKIFGKDHWVTYSLTPYPEETPEYIFYLNHKGTRMKIDGDKVIFSSGRKAYSNGGIIGLSPDGDIYEGYDGYFHLKMNSEEDDSLTKDELIDLADYMIERWKEFRKEL